MHPWGSEDAQRDRLCAIKIIMGFHAVNVSQALRVGGDIFDALICWS